MSEHFEAERDIPLRTTLLYRIDRPDAFDNAFDVPDKLWTEFAEFIRDLDMERRIRRQVLRENAAIVAERQGACDHARSAKLVDAATGLLRCDDCGAEFRYSDETEAPNPEQLERDKAERAEALASVAWRFLPAQQKEESDD